MFSTIGVLDGKQNSSGRTLLLLCQFLIISSVIPLGRLKMAPLASSSRVTDRWMKVNFVSRHTTTSPSEPG